MSRTTLIECSPRLPDGTVVTLRLVDRSPRAAAYLGAQWLPHVTELPAFESAIGFDGQRFGAAPSPQIGALGFALAPEIRSAAGWVWRDAAITIRQANWPLNGSNPADGDFTTSWVCDAASIAVNDGVARVELIDRGQKLRVPLAGQKFGTTGNALLDAAAAARDRAAGQVVPVAFGRCFTVPGLLVDRVNNIWLFAASAAASVQAFYDGGVPFTLGTARASLAALQGTAPAAGAVDYCLSASGLFLARPADRPVYPFTADATFGSAALGTVASNIVGGRLPFRTGVVTALNGLGLGDVELYIDDEATVADALDQLLAGLGIFWKVRADGTIDAKRIGWGSPAASFAAHQRHAPSRLRIILPTGRRQLGYAANNRVHGEGEIARILLATDLAYADGTAIEALKPADAGATNTAPANANRVPFDRMQGGKGWAVNANTSGLAVDLRPIEVGGFRFPQANITFTAAGQTVVIGGNVSFPVAGSERLSVAAGLDAYALTGPAPASWRLYADFIDEFNVPTQDTVVSGTGATSTFTRREAFKNGPASTRRAVLQLQVTSAGAGVVEIGVREATVASAAVGQTAHPAYTPGPNADNGADVTAAAVPILVLPPTTIIRADSAGTPDTGQLPRTLQVRVFRGGADVTTSTPLALSISPSGSATATIHATSGVITITAMAGRVANLTVTPTLAGLAAGTFALQRDDAAPPVSGSGGGGAASTSSLSSFSGSSYVVVATLTVTTGSGGAISLAAPLDISTTSAGGVFTVYGKTQRWNGSSWVDVSSEVSGASTITDGEPSSITITGSASGLGASTAIDVRLVMRTSTTGRTVDPSGTFSATGS